MWHTFDARESLGYAHQLVFMFYDDRQRRISFTKNEDIKSHARRGLE